MTESDPIPAQPPAKMSLAGGKETKEREGKKGKERRKGKKEKKGGRKGHGGISLSSIVILVEGGGAKAVQQRYDANKQ